MLKVFCSALFLLAGATVWAAQPIEGDWMGTLKPAPNVELRLLLHIKSDDGKLSASMDSVDQGANGLTVDSITLKGDKLVFDMNQINGSYDGKFDAAKKEIKGTWTQNGNSFPLDFVPYVPPKPKATTGAAVKPSDIDGSWEGKLDAGGQTLRVVFHIKTDEGGQLTGTTDSPDQNAFGIPMTSVSRDGNKVKIEVKAVGAIYDGTLNAAKTKMTGSLNQNGVLPLDLEKK